MNEEAKILIVENEQAIALETQSILKSMGYDVLPIVSSGEEAIRKAQEWQPDLVLITLPIQGEIEGVEVANQIRTRFDIPVVYITANISNAQMEELMRSEPCGFIFKPFEDMELHAAIQMALYRCKQRERHWIPANNYNSIIEHSHDGIFLLDDDYKFISTNNTLRIVPF